VDGAGATVPTVGAAGFAAAFLAACFFGLAFVRADFLLAALFFAGFFNDFLFAFFFAALLFFFFFAAFLPFLFLAMTDLHQKLMKQRTESAHGGAGYSTAGESPGPLNSFAARQQILMQDVGIEPDPAVPYDRRRFPIHDDATEPFHIPPGAESAHFEEIPEKHATFQTVVELQPEPVIRRGLALGHPMHACSRPKAQSKWKGPSPN
jgi:hypothetical protein